MTPPQQIALNQLTTLSADVRLIVIHPNFVPQHLLLPPLFENAVYLRLDGTQTTQTQLEQRFDEACVEQTNGAPIEMLDYVLLDESDRVDDAMLYVFIDSLLHRLRTGRIVLLTRSAPLALLTSPAMRTLMAFLPVSDSMMLWDYARQPESGGKLLEVRALGTGRVQLDGNPIKEWDGLLPRSLFFYLIDRGMATRNEIFETFWPNLSVREATNVFHVTKRKISEVLGVDLTVYWSGFYHISPRVHLSYDVSLFTQLFNEASVGTPEEAVEKLRQVAALYRGDFLSSLDMPWVQRRQDLLQMCGEALIALARTTESMGSPQQALGLYLRASTSNLQREDVAASIMRLYREQHQYSDALRVYRRLETELRESLNVSPAPPLQTLAREIESELERGQ